MLFKYYFKIKYINKIDNKKVDTLSRKTKLQGNKKTFKCNAKAR